MKTIVCLAVLTVLAGCEKKPAEEPPAKPAATRPVDAAVQLVIAIDPDRIRAGEQTIADKDGAVDRTALEAALGGDSVRTVELQVAPDATYQRVVDVMNVALKLGLEVGIAVGDLGPGGKDEPAPVGHAIPDPDHPIMVITVSTDAIFLGGRSIAMIAELAPGGDDVPKLREAIAALPDERRANVALEADRSIRGEVLVRVIAAARHGGVPRVLFVVQGPTSASPPPRRP